MHDRLALVPSFILDNNLASQLLVYKWIYIYIYIYCLAAVAMFASQIKLITHAD